jgi:hypothetical protein
VIVCSQPFDLVSEVLELPSWAPARSTMDPTNMDDPPPSQ